MAKRYIAKVFVLEDDDFYTRLIEKALEDEDELDLTFFKTGQEFLDQIHNNPDIVSIDHYLPDMEGLEVLKKIRHYNEEIMPIVVSGQEDVEVVVECFDLGAKEYIVKKQDSVTKLANAIKNLKNNVDLKKEVEELKGMVIDREKYQQITGESKAILQVLRLIQKVEKTNMMVLITGESGTGKEIAAKTIHYNSPRQRKPFVPVNMAAIPEDLVESELFGHEKGAFTGANTKRIGKFEEANGGTIFLDEIGEMDMSLQTKLLRVLQDSKISRIGSNKEITLDARVIAATNKNLAELVKRGKFREDLFYRLQGFLVDMPPLRERGNDVIILARQFLNEFSKQNKMPVKEFSKDALQTLLDHDWPGNVRELSSVIERAVLIAEEDQITADDLIFPQTV